MATFREVDDAYHGRGAYEGDARVKILVDMAAAEWQLHERFLSLSRKARYSSYADMADLYHDAAMRHYDTWRTLCMAIAVYIDPRRPSDADDTVIEYTSALDLHNDYDKEG